MLKEGEIARIERGAITVVIQVERDHHPDLSWLGKFTTRQTERTIPVDPAVNPELSYALGKLYFIPGYDYTEGDNKYHWKQGMSRGEIDRLLREYIYRDMRRLIDYHRGEWWVAHIITYVHINGITLGFDSLSGVESNGKQAYIDDIIWQLVLGALDRVEHKLISLQSPLVDEVNRFARIYDRLYRWKYPPKPFMQRRMEFHKPAKVGKLPGKVGK